MNKINNTQFFQVEIGKQISAKDILEIVSKVGFGVCPLNTLVMVAKGISASFAISASDKPFSCLIIFNFSTYGINKDLFLCITQI